MCIHTMYTYLYAHTQVHIHILSLSLYTVRVARSLVSVDMALGLLGVVEGPGNCSSVWVDASLPVT